MWRSLNDRRTRSRKPFGPLTPRRASGVVLVIAAALSGGYGVHAAQDFAWPTLAPFFRSTVDLVLLHVTASDGSGNYLTDIDRREFMVFENGRRQEVALFQEGGLPLAVTVLVDASSSVKHVFPRVQEAAVRFLRELQPGDIASVMTFGDSVRLLQEFTDDRTALQNGVRQAKAHGGTALYEALYIALKQLNAIARPRDGAVPRRRVVVVLSDGEDTSSLIGFDDLVDLATRSDVAIYAVRMGRTAAPGDYGESEYILGQLARRTGGRAFLSLNPDELQRTYADIRVELAAQYVLAYVSSDPRKDGRFRTLSVQIGRAGAKARTRRGYVAPESSNAFRR